VKRRSFCGAPSFTSDGLLFNHRGTAIELELSAWPASKIISGLSCVHASNAASRGEHSTGPGNSMAFTSQAGPRTPFLQRFDPGVRVVLPNLPLSEATNSQEPNAPPLDLLVLRSDRPESVAAIDGFMDLDLAYRSFVRRLIKSEPSAHDSSSPFSLR
jgi:hypothetical protein